MCFLQPCFGQINKSAELKSIPHLTCVSLHHSAMANKEEFASCLFYVYALFVKQSFDS